MKRFGVMGINRAAICKTNEKLPHIFVCIKYSKHVPIVFQKDFSVCIISNQSIAKRFFLNHNTKQARNPRPIIPAAKGGFVNGGIQAESLKIAEQTNPSKSHGLNKINLNALQRRACN